MTKPILLDMDGVFADFAAAYMALARATDRELYDNLIDNRGEYFYYLNEHIKDNVIRQRGYDLSNHPSIFALIPPYEGAIEGVKLLKKLLDERDIGLYICTAPHTTNHNSYTDKAKWISHYLGNEWLDMTLMVRDKTIVQGSILIDDKPVPLGKFTPSWKHVIMPHVYNLEQQKTHFVFGGWDKDSLIEVIEYAQLNKG